ncbi:hypothetical protein N8525_03915 [Verrucomicrobiales bacterium]|nr:hypothetical protein [Verrucomicrobiales bacterium]MDB4632740.1 hypothetical protein [bacterium]
MNSVTILSPLTIAAMAVMVGMALGDDDRRALRESADRAAEAIRESRQSPSNSDNDIREHYESEREALREDLAREISKLGDGPSREAVDRVVKGFKREHEEALKEQQNLAKDLSRDATGNSRLAALTDYHDERSKATEERRQERQRYNDQLLDANSPEERERLRNDFREDQRARHQEMKSALQSLLREVRGGHQSGSRRIDAS